MNLTRKFLSGILQAAFGLLLALCVSCKGPDKPFPEEKQSVKTRDSLEGVENIERILTAEEQAKLRPDSVLKILIKGNQDFVNGELTVRNHRERIRRTAMGQYPKAIILSCMDSRVPVEDVFNMGLGSLFVLRVAGNIVNEDILGSLEYGCKVSGAKLILVLGHEYCGAIKAAIDDTKLGNISSLLARIRPAVTALKNFQGDRTSGNPAFVHAVCVENIKLGLDIIRRRSPMLEEMEARGEIKILGGIYNMQTGQVALFQNK